MEDDKAVLIRRECEECGKELIEGHLYEGQKLICKTCLGGEIIEKCLKNGGLQGPRRPLKNLPRGITPLNLEKKEQK